MGKSHSTDLRERVLRSIEDDMSKAHEQGGCLSMMSFSRALGEIGWTRKSRRRKKAATRKSWRRCWPNRGTLRMNGGPAAPRVKYRAVLVDYRAALQADPNNAEAKANKKLIENIYTSMGRPVPQ